jgi:hypothetical protein
VIPRSQLDMALFSQQLIGCFSLPIGLKDRSDHREWMERAGRRYQGVIWPHSEFKQSTRFQNGHGPRRMQTCTDELTLYVGRERLEPRAMFRRITRSGCKLHPHVVGDKHRVITQGVLRKTVCSNDDRTLMDGCLLGKAIL